MLKKTNTTPFSKKLPVSIVLLVLGLICMGLPTSAAQEEEEKAPPVEELVDALTTAAETAAVDTESEDTAANEAISEETPIPETNAQETEAPETTLPDASDSDAVISDAVISDTGNLDSGNLDNGATESSATETSQGSAFTAKVEASLDPQEWKIEGKETLTVFNRTNNPTSELVLACMPNTFANTESIERAGIALPCVYTCDEAGTAHLGYIDIREFHMDGRTPDPAPVMDGIELRLALGTPLAPGGSLTVTIDFVVKLPDRSLGWFGRKGRHVDASRWFPTPALLTDVGWSLKHGDPLPLGDVEVSLSLPSSFNVDACGELKESHVENAIKTVRFAAKQVPDLAWTADPTSLVERNIFEGVEIVLHRQPFMEAKSESLLNAAKECLKYCNQHLIPYPHKRLVIATPPYGMGQEIESPMLVSASQGFPSHLKVLKEKTMSPVLHLIRSWAQSFVKEIIRDKPGSGIPFSMGLGDYVALKIMERHIEVPEAERVLTGMEYRIIQHVLNNGFGLYDSDGANDAEGVCCGKLKPYYGFVNVNSVMGFGESAFNGDPIDQSLLGYRLGVMNRGGLDHQWIACIKDASALSEKDTPCACPGIASAARITLGLMALDYKIGEEKSSEVIKGFVEKYGFKYAGLDEFLNQVEAVSDAETAAFAALVLDPEATVDMAIASIECTPAKLPRGFITQNDISDPIAENTAPESEEGWSMGFALGELIGWNGDAREGAADPSTAPAVEAPAWQWNVSVTNYGNAALPTKVLLTFQSGKTETREWNGLGRSADFSGSGVDPLVSAKVDPEGVYIMDPDLLNNFRSVAYQEQGVLFMAAWLQFWTQNYLNGWAFLN